MSKRVAAAVAIGSNAGDRRSHFDFACERLSRLLDGLRVSPIYETEPIEVTEPQPPFLNAAAVGTTDLPARELLTLLLETEQERGRERPYWHAPRTLDLDLILYGDHVIDEPGLIVPHPLFRERAFVLEPLAAIAPGLIDPVTGKTIAMLLAELQGRKQPFNG